MRHLDFKFFSLLMVCVSLLGVRAQSTAPPVIPLCQGLTIVTAVSQSDGDYESIKTIEVVDPNDVQLKYSAEVRFTDFLSSAPPTLRKVVLHRTMLVADLESARTYQQNFMEKSAETIPGTTAIGTSTGILKDLKTKGEVQLSLSNAYSGLELTADKSKHPNYYEYTQVANLKRTGTTTVRVLVNDQPVDLPAVRAEGESFGDKDEFLFLDDEKNPLTLAFRLGIGAIKPLDATQKKLCERLLPNGVTSLPFGGGRCDLPNGGDRDTLRVIKITYRCGKLSTTAGDRKPSAGQAEALSTAAKNLERALSDTGRAEIYSIYFSFNSDVIRDESEPTLKEIAEVMKRHVDWKLQVNGHTDGIGTDQYNLDLSKRRAAAVKDALVKRYGIDAARLTTQGLGKSQPKDTNDTLEGRARNRRVELVRW